MTTVRPATMIAPETGAVPRRDIRPFVVAYKGESITVDLLGYYPDDQQTDGVHVGDDMSVVDAALRALREIEGIPTPATILRVRTKLKLSRREDEALLKVGENAFDKHERGLVEPSGPTSQLLKLLDRHPEMVEELRSQASPADARRPVISRTQP